ncbi:MAG TPA: nucleotide exchange factor GrpE, partial [Burkholderiaceae bacterium]|nr:nucleotide exchange factor GrpE [Burkholderiaceae bacterium]
MHDPDAFPVKDAANETLETEAANGAATDAPPFDAEQELQRAMARADQFQDQFLRAKAEAENVRRRG